LLGDIVLDRLQLWRSADCRDYIWVHIKDGRMAVSRAVLNSGSRSPDKGHSILLTLGCLEEASCEFLNRLNREPPLAYHRVRRRETRHKRVRVHSRLCYSRRVLLVRDAAGRCNFRKELLHKMRIGTLTQLENFVEFSRAALPRCMNGPANLIAELVLTHINPKAQTTASYYATAQGQFAVLLS
jgi:hypothetical protein